jgi:hypothetical protein
VTGTECRPDWQLCIGAQLFTSIGVMFLLLPLFSPLIGILSLVAGLLNRAWVYAIGSALFFGWLLAASFPLSA